MNSVTYISLDVYSERGSISQWPTIMAISIEDPSPFLPESRCEFHTIHPPATRCLSGQSTVKRAIILLLRPEALQNNLLQKAPGIESDSGKCSENVSTGAYQPGTFAG
jgi:hypothetical protein